MSHIFAHAFKAFLLTALCEHTFVFKSTARPYAFPAQECPI